MRRKAETPRLANWRRVSGRADVWSALSYLWIWIVALLDSLPQVVLLQPKMFAFATAIPLANALPGPAVTRISRRWWPPLQAAWTDPEPVAVWLPTRSVTPTFTNAFEVALQSTSTADEIFVSVFPWPCAYFTRRWTS